MVPDGFGGRFPVEGAAWLDSWQARVLAIQHSRQGQLSLFDPAAVAPAFQQGMGHSW